MPRSQTVVTGLMAHWLTWMLLVCDGSCNAQPTTVYWQCCLVGQCLFQASFFWGGGVHPKNVQSPSPNGCQIVCSKSFSRPDSELQIYHGNVLLIDNKHRQFFAIGQPKGFKFMPKMHLNVWRRAPPGPAGGAYALPQTPPLAAMGRLLLRGTGGKSEGRKERGRESPPKSR